MIDDWGDHAATDRRQPINRARQCRDLFNSNGILREYRRSICSAGVVERTARQRSHTAVRILFGTGPGGTPNNLVATPASGTQINLSWSDTSSIETGVIVQRKQGLDGSYAQVVALAPNTTSYLDSGLLANTTYYYRVQAANFVSNSGFSNEAFATTPVPPSTPSNAHATIVGTTSVAFAWQDNSNNEDKFSIFRKVNNGSFIFVADVPANTTNYEFSRCGAYGEG